ncbi:GH-E family nuclease [Glycomyces sp. NPDC047010]|uniref:GH-E family nuclease n=1 Tax=Glycomyces sp. NPDC047010 TaxID=3155023 RepID=UPI0033C5F0DF
MRRLLRQAVLLPILLGLIGLHTRHHGTDAPSTHTPSTDTPNSDSPDRPTRRSTGLPGQSHSGDVQAGRELASSSRPSSTTPSTQKRGEGGRFVFDPDKPERKTPSVEEDPHQRPGLRTTTRDEIWDNAVTSSDDGKVRDPETNEVIDRDSNWQAGHLPGWEFRKHRAEAQAADTPRDDFIDEYNTAERFRPETKATNESHKGEAPDSVNHWKDFYDSKE